uniref:Uncharacterized protein n=1 Tax=Arundo donax TaxID=35708 RepID=A0A0A9BYZ9_ARUDO
MRGGVWAVPMGCGQCIPHTNHSTLLRRQKSQVMTML